MRLKKVISSLLVSALTVGMLTACGGGNSSSTTNAGGDGSANAGSNSGAAANEETITLTCFSELANYSGEMQGWFAKVMLDKFNVKINLVASGDGVYETRMEDGDLGDIVVWGSDGKNYMQAVEAGLLFDWEEDDILAEYGPDIKANMPYALEKNREISGQDTIYGFGHNVASSSESHEAFFYTWDIRWDLYEQLGHPEVKNLDDMVSLFKQMQEICPTDDSGNPTYAMSLWPDWDGNYVMYVKSMATAYYGYDEFGIGHYNPTNGEWYYSMDEGSPYLEMLEFFNTLYREGLLDPDSMTQNYDKMIEKVQNGGVFFSIFNYAGSAGYNSEDHIAENKIMRSLVPTEASPIAYGMSVYGGNRIWSIGANTQYPELCMEIINWLCTPEGRITMDYGPQGLCWDYNEDGRIAFTDFGKTCDSDRTTVMPEEWGGATFNDGAFQINNTTWSSNDTNPVTGEKYNKEFWASTQTPDGLNEADKDWRETTGCTTVEEYMESGNYKVDIATTFAEGSRSAELDVIWNQVKECIVQCSWQAIYCDTVEEFDAKVKEMQGKVRMYDPQQQCKKWCEEEAARKNELQAPLRK
ncbi:MAG: hypothetical protein IJZ82_02695 [Lachnospiraceae bacterium]|nr:hypothetical protein [Lachnospiraceae bacterium]